MLNAGQSKRTRCGMGTLVARALPICMHKGTVELGLAEVPERYNRVSIGGVNRLCCDSNPIQGPSMTDDMISHARADVLFMPIYSARSAFLPSPGGTWIVEGLTGAA